MTYLDKMKPEVGAHAVQQGLPELKILIEDVYKMGYNAALMDLHLTMTRLHISRTLDGIDYIMHSDEDLPLHSNRFKE